MKKFYLSFAVLAMFAAWFSVDLEHTAAANGTASPLVSPDLVISQFQAGGTSNANDEFIEIHNTATTVVDLIGYRVVYRSQNGVNDVNFMAWTSSTMLQPGQYFLIASTAYTGSVTPDATYNNTTCMCALAAANGGLAIRQGPANTGAVIDAVGWGTGSNIFFEGSRTTEPGNSNSKIRVDQGCQDTDNNAADFATQSPSAPRNTATPPALCSGGSPTLFASIGANPTTVAPGGTTRITVNVQPATEPPSTGITVIGNFSNIGGPALQALLDDGTNGDVTPGDNIYSFLATVGEGTTGGTFPVTVQVSDAQARTLNLSQNITVNAPYPGENPLIFGNPSNATTDVANENNYLMAKPQYTMSYNRSKATANWVAWRLDSTWIGNSGRQDDFRPDTTLPAGWYQVLASDYSGSGYSRGHIVPSGDRTRSVPDNSATFLMTNMMPQLAANNEGPWNDFENYLRSLAGGGNEIYIISGPTGNQGLIAGGKVVVPQYTWKVVLVLPNGNNDLERVSKATRAFGIVVPNFSPITTNAWRNYRVTVDAVEYITGHNFFSEIPKNTQELIERKRDKL
ncbi:hypothetical protein BH20ACI2_BH20ACI2_13150 [soil metagenome]